MSRRIRRSRRADTRPPSRRKVPSGTAAHPERGPILLAIIFLKYLKGLLFVLAGLALFGFRKDPSARWLLRVAERADGDPRLRVTARVLRDLSHVFELHFSAIVASCLIAGVALASEGTFLLRGYTWAPWVTIFLTGVWIPVEVWEIVRRFSLRTLVIMLINLAIVVYLYRHRRDFQHRVGE